jgi:hypothetical protein
MIRAKLRIPVGFVSINSSVTFGWSGVVSPCKVVIFSDAGEISGVSDLNIKTAHCAGEFRDQYARAVLACCDWRELWAGLDGWRIMAALKSKMKAFIIQSIAFFDSPSQVVEFVQKEFSIKITRQQVES